MPPERCPRRTPKPEPGRGVLRGSFRERNTFATLLSPPMATNMPRQRSRLEAVHDGHLHVSIDRDDHDAGNKTLPKSLARESVYDGHLHVSIERDDHDPGNKTLPKSLARAMTHSGISWNKPLTIDTLQAAIDAAEATSDLPSLDRDICLRCSKHLHEGSELQAVGRGFYCGRESKYSECSYCVSIEQPCEPVPAEFYKRVNTLIAYRASIDGPSVDNENLAFKKNVMAAAVKLYISNLAAWNKERANREPSPSPADYGKLQLEEIRDIKESLALIAECCVKATLKR